MPWETNILFSSHSIDSKVKNSFTLYHSLPFRFYIGWRKDDWRVNNLWLWYKGFCITSCPGVGNQKVGEGGGWNTFKIRHLTKIFKCMSDHRINCKTAPVQFTVVCILFSMSKGHFKVLYSLWLLIQNCQTFTKAQPGDKCKDKLLLNIDIKL